MSTKQLITPVLYQVNNKKYKLFYLTFSEDGSIYVLFPKKPPYFIDSKKNIKFLIAGEQQIILKKLKLPFESPYISFHPSKNIIHINSLNKDHFNSDLKVLNLSENKNICAFPMCQIVFSKFDFLNQYTKDKYQNPLTINSPTLIPEKSLSIEIWIHPVGTYFETSDIPLFSSRIKHQNIIGLYKFNSSKISKYTCSLLVSELNKSEDKNKHPGIVLVVFNEKEPYALSLLP